MSAAGQQVADPSKLPLVPYSPSIYGINAQNEISISTVFAQGLKVILADKTFKVIQFDVLYDCHSRSMLDFDTKRYFGDKVDPKDEYLRKRILAGDAMDIFNTVIEKNGLQYRMKEFSFVVTK
jgi:hypothetical protein